MPLGLAVLFVNLPFSLLSVVGFCEATSYSLVLSLPQLFVPNEFPKHLPVFLETLQTEKNEPFECCYGGECPADTVLRKRSIRSS